MENSYPLYPQCQDDIDEWKEMSMDTARSFLKEGDELNDALAILVDLSLSQVTRAEAMGHSLADMKESARSVGDLFPFQARLILMAVAIEEKRIEMQEQIRERGKCDGCTPRE